MYHRRAFTYWPRRQKMRLCFIQEFCGVTWCGVVWCGMVWCCSLPSNFELGYSVEGASCARWVASLWDSRIKPYVHPTWTLWLYHVLGHRNTKYQISYCTIPRRHETVPYRTLVEKKRIPLTAQIRRNQYTVPVLPMCRIWLVYRHDTKKIIPGTVYSFKKKRYREYPWFVYPLSAGLSFFGT